METRNEKDRRSGIADLKTLPVILIHGFPFDSSMWELVMTALGPQMNVIAPNLRGFGGTPPGKKEPSLDVMADDIAGMMDRNKIQKAVVAGMSMGGYVALAFAERHADRLAGLGLISTQSLADTDQARAGRQATITKVRDEGADVVANAMAPKLFSAKHANDAGMIAIVHEGARKAGVEGICWALEAMARRPDRTHVISGLDVPVVVVHGTADQIIPPARAEEMARLARKGQYVAIPEAGHGTPMEAPAEVAGALADLLLRSARSAL